MEFKPGLSKEGAAVAAGQDVNQMEHRSPLRSVR